MKLVILGASGGIGRHLVKRAVARGHNVVAVARSTSTLEVSPLVQVERGALMDLAFLTRAFEGADAVLSSIGLMLPGLSPFAKAEVPDLLTAVSPVIAQACKDAGVGRIVAVSAGGVGDSRAMMPGFFKLFIAVTAMRPVYKELEEMERVFAASGLEVCCVRPTGLNDDPATGKVVVPERLVGHAQIPRADVAAYMLDAVEAEEMPGFGPVITVTGGA